MYGANSRQNSVAKTESQVGRAQARADAASGSDFPEEFDLEERLHDQAVCEEQLVLDLESEHAFGPRRRRSRWPRCRTNTARAPECLTRPTSAVVRTEVLPDAANNVPPARKLTAVKRVRLGLFHTAVHRRLRRGTTDDPDRGRPNLRCRCSRPLAPSTDFAIRADRTGRNRSTPDRGRRGPRHPGNAAFRSSSVIGGMNGGNGSCFWASSVAVPAAAGLFLLVARVRSVWARRRSTGASRTPAIEATTSQVSRRVIPPPALPETSLLPCETTGGSDRPSGPSASAVTRYDRFVPGGISSVCLRTWNLPSSSSMSLHIPCR